MTNQLITSEMQLTLQPYLPINY